MDDETIVELLITAELRAPCADVRARCELVAQVHKFWIDILHTEGRTEDRRILSWRTLTETSREAQVAGLAGWLSHLHIANRHPGRGLESDADRCGDGCAPTDAGAPAHAARRDGIAGSGDGRGDDALWDRVSSARAD